MVVIVGAISRARWCCRRKPPSGNAWPLRSGPMRLSRSGWGYPLLAGTTPIFHSGGYRRRRTHSGSETASILQATLQNTLEQTVLAVLVHLAWAILMPVSWMSAIPAAVVLFCVVVSLFAWLSRRCAVSGGGFALTYYPSVLMLIFVVVAAVGRRSLGVGLGHEREVRGVKVARKEQAAHGIRFSISGDDGEIARAYLYVMSNDLHTAPFRLLEDVYVDESQRGSASARSSSRR